MNIDINGECVLDEIDFHKQLAAALGVQEYYGCNLNALWDLLGFGVERPIFLRWKNSKISKLNIGPSFEKIVNILEEVRLQDERFGWEEKFTYKLD